MTRPMISVLLPVCNAEPFLPEAIDSVLSQTLSDFEVIMIDDGSTDDSLRCMREYAQKDGRIRILTRENRGLAATLNEALGLAEGIYIARMDADDICAPVRFRRQVDFLEANTRVGVVGSALSLFGEGIQPDVWRPPLNHFSIKAMHIFNCSLYHPTVMIRKAVLQEHGFWYREDFRQAQDYDLWVRMQRVTELANLHDVLLRYRRHAGAIGSISQSRQIEAANRIRFDILTQDLSLMPSEEEKKLHVAFAYALRSEIQGNEECLHEWLLKLRKAIRRGGYTSDRAMTEAIKTLNGWLFPRPWNPFRKLMSSLKTLFVKPLRGMKSEE